MSLQVQNGPLCFSFSLCLRRALVQTDHALITSIKGEKVKEFCKAGFFIAALVCRLMSCLCCEFCWKGGGPLFRDLHWVWYSSQRGRRTGGLLINCPALGLGPSRLGTSNYTFTFFLANSFSIWNRKLFADHRKTYITGGRRSLGTIRFYLFSFTDGERPRGEKIWTRLHKESVSGRTTTGSEKCWLWVFFLVYYIVNIISNIYWALTMWQITVLNA